MQVVGFQIQQSDGHHIGQIVANRYNEIDQLLATKYSHQIVIFGGHQI
jgi:hypothetical protein